MNTGIIESVITRIANRLRSVNSMQCVSNPCSFLYKAKRHPFGWRFLLFEVSCGTAPVNALGNFSILAIGIETKRRAVFFCRYFLKAILFLLMSIPEPDEQRRCCSQKEPTQVRGQI